jgi:hypothetical protein
MIQHTIEWTTEGYRLIIWEAAPTTAIRTSPFFFRANYLLSCPSKALAILNMVKGENSTAHALVRPETWMIEPDRRSAAPLSTDHL